MLGDCDNETLELGLVLADGDTLVLALGDGEIDGEGLIDNTLPQLNALLKELTGTSRRLGSLIEEVQASPQMLLSGRSRRPPGPGEDGFEADRK